jgi:chromosome segregation ATPase
VPIIETAAVALVVGGGGVAWGRLRSQNKADDARARRDDAEAEAIEVRTARELVAEVRSEMNRRVSDLDRELGRLRGLLEATERERDHLRQIERQLREENAQLRQRIDALEARIAELTDALAAAQRQGV